MNPMFDLLTGGDRYDDEGIEGLVAYSLYKRHKRQWASRFQEQNGRDPSDDEKQAFATSVSTDDQCDRYRMDAQDILIGFANSFVEAEKPEIEKNAVAGELKEAAMKVVKASSFISLVRVGVASTLVTSVLLALLAFSTQLFGIDLVDALHNSRQSSSSASTWAD